jgi:type 1 glutamine amidotransferase
MARAALVAVLFAMLGERPPVEIPGEAAAPARRILVFSKTTGFRHASIPDAVAALRALGAGNGFAVDATEDASVFEDARLSPYDAVVFALTTGDVLDAAQQSALERFVRGGRGYAGIHSASDTEHGWPWYGELVGAFFLRHPEIASAAVDVSDRVHDSTRDLPARWTRVDEWYDFATNPRDRVHVLATVDEATYAGGTMGPDHPIAWCRYFDGGRAWYTAMGHTAESYADPLFRAHLLGGIRFAAGYPDCDPAPRPRVLPPR